MNRTYTCEAINQFSWSAIFTEGTWRSTCPRELLYHLCEVALLAGAEATMSQICEERLGRED